VNQVLTKNGLKALAAATPGLVAPVCSAETAKH
jgi:hypothetical protein